MNVTSIQMPGYTKKLRRTRCLELIYKPTYILARSFCHLLPKKQPQMFNTNPSFNTLLKNPLIPEPWCLPRVAKWIKWMPVRPLRFPWNHVHTFVSRFAISIARVFPKQYHYVIEMRSLDMGPGGVEKQNHGGCFQVWKFQA